MTDQERRWHRNQCKLYQTEYPIYQKYAVALERIFRAACTIYAPTAIVQVRPKGLASFAEKMARKAKRYMIFGIGPTDLCGARIITETLEEVDRLCAVIRENFTIDEENSLDARSRMNVDQFGYLSYHYVLQLKRSRIFGEAVPPEIGDRKAELQVRTLLQHAHASIGHDRFYKTSLTVQESLKRQMARVAALLEEGDKEFGECVSALDSYKLHYGAYLTKDKLQEEQAILEMVLASEPTENNRPAIALRLAQLARATGDYRRVAKILEPFLTSAKSGLEVQAERAHATCRLHADQPRGQDFNRALDDLEAMVGRASGSLKSRILGYRAWARSRIPDNEEKARNAYREALNADTLNPFYLIAYLEYEMSLGEPLALREALRPNITRAIDVCRAHINAGIEVPWSLFTIGRLKLLLGEHLESLGAYSKAIQLCLQSDSTMPLAAIDEELAFLRRINRGRQMDEPHEWVHTLLDLGRAVRRREPPSLVKKRNDFQQPIVILAGATAKSSEGEVSRFARRVLDAFAGFTGTIISGGTRSGVAGLAGKIAATQKARAGGVLEVLGYIPSDFPSDQDRDNRYTGVVRSDGQHYGVRPVLQYWADLLHAGIDPKDVRLLGIDGGQVALFEYQLALAFGAVVGVMEPASRSGSQILKDTAWTDTGRLLRIVEDVRTIQAFIRPPKSGLEGKKLEKAAMRIHQAFLDEKHHQHPDPAMKPWENLDKGFQDSNRMQAAAIAGLLERAGLIVEKRKGTVKPLQLNQSEVEELAEMEHGRWNVERLQGGWRYGDVRDPGNKTHPDLIAWENLPDKVKQWDRNAVSKWTTLLAEAGLGVRRSPRHRSKPASHKIRTTSAR